MFAAHGRACWHCGKDATDAAHVIPRAKLGPLRYAIPAENGRPACRACHQRQELGEIDFPIAVLRAAIKAHNKIAKIKLPVP